MPTEKEPIYEKSTPESVPWNTMIQYTFKDQDDTKNTEEIRAYRIPYSDRTFWTNFRIGAFHANGILQTDNIVAQIVLRTSDGADIAVIPWKEYPPQRWWSTRWAIPSLSFAEGCGVWIEVKTKDSIGLYRVELQGFQEMYPQSDHYVLLDENDRRCFLFKQDRPVPVSECRNSPIASIYDMYDGDPTHAIDPAEIDGVPLFPIWKYIGKFRNGGWK